MAQEAIDPDGRVTELAHKHVDAGELSSDDQTPHEGELETWVVVGDLVNEMAHRLALLPRSQRPLWWHAVAVDLPLKGKYEEVTFTMISITPDEVDHVRAVDLIGDGAYKVDYESSVNVDDIEILCQNLGILDDSPEYARRVK